MILQSILCPIKIDQDGDTDRYHLFLRSIAVSLKPARLHVTVVHAWHVHACQTYKQLSVGLVRTRGKEKLEKALRNWAESLLPPNCGINVWPCSMQRACAQAQVGKSFVPVEIALGTVLVYYCHNYNDITVVENSGQRRIHAG